MEKPLKFKEIKMPYPNHMNTYTDYTQKLQPKMDFESASFKQFYEKHKEELLKASIKECEQYLDADDWMDEETFPYIKDLTGEWYLSLVQIWQEQDGTINISLYLHFLGYYPAGCARMEIDDYLGIDVLFEYNPILKSFRFDGLNTACI